MHRYEKENLAVFLPTRKGSQRVKNKNTRKFACFESGLLELKLRQLRDISCVSEIVLSSNDDESLAIGEMFSKTCSKLRIVKRPDHLSENTTNLTDLVKYVPSICDTEHILWTHVTSPFFEAEDYEKAIRFYFQAIRNGYDSLMSVKRYKEFLWSKEKNDLVNRATPQKWPQTQDLAELYEIDNAIFIASRNVYIDQSDRIGKQPELFVQDGIKAFDIDWEDDFSLAEMIYEKNIRK